jgi:hypothetical protein
VALLEACRQSGDVTCAQQCPERHRHEIRIAEEARAIGESVFQGLGQQVDRQGGSRRKPRWIGDPDLPGRERLRNHHPT